MSNSDASPAPTTSSAKFFLRVFQASVLPALLYFLAAFLLGWAMGGPDTVDGSSVLSFRCAPITASNVAIGAIIYLSFLLMLFLLSSLAPKPEAWLTRITQRRGIFVGLFALVGTAAVVCGLFLAAFLGTGCNSFLQDLSSIALVGVLTGGFLQLMSAAVKPNPHSERDKRILAKQQEIARKRAVELGVDPDEAAAETEKIWNETGKGIGRIMEKALGFVAAISGSGAHGGLLFVFGASFFIGLGFGVSGPTVSVLYFIPLLLGLADAATLLTFHALLRRVGESKQLAWAAGVSLPIAMVGMVYKAILIVTGAAALGYAGGPEIFWTVYVEATQAAPFGSGLTVTVILLARVAWPLLLLAGPAGREFSQG